jgi:uncharacterized membrane protein YfcA
MDSILLALSVFLAVFTQSLSGFGVALVAMSLLPGLVGIRIATPLVALVALTIEIFLLIRYKEALNLRTVWPIALASVAGVPIGIIFLRIIPEKVVLTLLGFVIVAYALYALLKLKLPILKSPVWAYAAGLVAGMLGGAYNTSGPPVIIYGDCSGWEPAEFKSNLQGFFVFNSVFIAIGHIVSGNFSPDVWTNYWISLPAMAGGIILGVSLDKYVNPITFRQIVLALLVMMGIRMIIFA